MTDPQTDKLSVVLLGTNETIVVQGDHYDVVRRLNKDQIAMLTDAVTYDDLAINRDRIILVHPASQEVVAQVRSKRAELSGIVIPNATNQRGLV